MQDHSNRFMHMWIIIANSSEYNFYDYQKKV